MNLAYYHSTETFDAILGAVHQQYYPGQAIRQRNQASLRGLD